MPEVSWLDFHCQYGKIGEDNNTPTGDIRAAIPQSSCPYPSLRNDGAI